MAAAIQTVGLTKRYGDRAAVDGLEISVPHASITGFLGPNGAGKTTTIRILLGLIRPTSGHAEVLGHPLSRPREYLPRVGALVDGPALYPRLSGHANLDVLSRLGGANRRGGDVANRISCALEATGMSARAHDRVVTYSLGMRQRLAIAAALLTDPDLLILDEPTNGLDPEGIVEIRSLLRRLADEGKTVFVSSHQLAELEQICDHLVLLREGRTIYQGGLGELLGRRPSTIVAAPEDPSRVDELLEIARDRGWEAHGEQDTVSIGAPESAAAELNRASHEQGITLVELWRRPPTLEETFLAVAGNDGEETP